MRPLREWWGQEIGPGCTRYRACTRALQHPGSGCRDGDFSVDDLLLVLVELAGDVVDEATAGGVTDALSRQVEPLHTRREGAVRVLGEVLEDRHVDVLEHRRHDDVLDRRVGELVLV